MKSKLCMQINYSKGIMNNAIGLFERKKKKRDIILFFIFIFFQSFKKEEEEEENGPGILLHCLALHICM